MVATMSEQQQIKISVTKLSTDSINTPKSRLSQLNCSFTNCSRVKG